VRAVTGVPIKFLGTGEKLSELEVFYPDRLASRILGMGDMLTLIERAEADMDEEVALESVERLMEGKFNLEDFLKQLQQVKKMGPITKLLEMVPGMNQLAKEIEPGVAEKQMARTEAIINSMTTQERKYPKVLNSSRKRRIAAGSGSTVQEINQLLKQFREMQKMMRQLKNPRKRRGLMNMFGGMGGMG